MLSTNDFAQRVWVSLEDIRERLAVLETEMRHARRHLHRLESNQHSHPPVNQGASPVGATWVNQAGQAVSDLIPVNGATFTLRLSRRALGGGGILGGGLAGIAAGTAKALGWW